MKILPHSPAILAAAVLAGLTVLAQAQSENPIELAAPTDKFQETGTLNIDVEGERKVIRYYPLDGDAVIEGDIVLGTVEEVAAINLLAGADFERIEDGTQKTETRDGLSTMGLDRRFFERVLPRALAIKASFGGRARRWPNATVPYEVDPNLPNPDRVERAIAHWESKTPLRFVKRESGNPKHVNHVVFTGTAGGGACSSNVGVAGGRQNIKIDAVCSLGNVIHEIGHAVGLAHEQSRSDRDNFVEIIRSNIVPAALGNFEINARRNDDVNEYDYGSLMHYPRRGFAIDPSKDTVRPLRNVQIGQRSGLSDGDIRAIQRLYAQ